MTPDETAALLAYASAIDPRIRRNDPAERRLQVAAWHTQLADVQPADAKTAVDAHYARAGADAALPGDIATRARAACTAARRERLEQLGAAFEAATLPAVDPDDVPGYLRALRSARRQVADGELDAGDDSALPARAVDLGGVFRVVPPRREAS